MQIENPIVHPDFLLQSDVARELYHDYAAKIPIIDYHCHLPPADIALDRRFENLSQIWLEGDHYKWRAMRTHGIDEHYCTGAASDKEKFNKWAETVPYTLRNPLYHWTHLELKYPFGITEILNAASGDRIYQKGTELLQSEGFSVRGLLHKFNVKTVCTTEDPIDTLEHHAAIQADGFGVKVSTAWRPDNAIAVQNVQKFNVYIDKLATSCNKNIATFDDYLQALHQRHEFFHSMGCRLSDHGLDGPFPVTAYTDAEIKSIFGKLRTGQAVSPMEEQMFAACMLYNFAVMDFEKGWVQQYHVGAIRNVNLKAIREIGEAKGFDSIHDFSYAASMGAFFNRLEEESKLAKTILYNLNPRDNEMIATMIGNFQNGKVVSRFQYGSGWWFLDQKDGMEKQLNALSNMGLLFHFVGMVTDSRSFLSYSRHEYFRRILCNLLGRDVVNGEIPKDMKLLAQMVEAICYNNANDYFDF
ncbi:glucuronate isomerase [Mucilaginibacter yixingensis]|uniref:Uronate isomerase n=1 Tax=Mucilaginibacter yixingensis TaxID=1295612 RepID=A0A2T5JGL5_9SPHI|nr:glucuronate isomerase [Mucilaginibacter yixingensis]PTR01534.1 glucuronate isomerase [Mucilaginibacter yixingensis]